MSHTSHTPVNIGLLGGGTRLRNVLENMLAVAGGKVRAIAAHDPDAQAQEKLRDLVGQECNFRSSEDEVINDPEVDWIFIGSWNSLHAKHAIRALSKGKNVFCEKPLATTIEDCLARRRCDVSHPGDGGLAVSHFFGNSEQGLAFARPVVGVGVPGFVAGQGRSCCEDGLAHDFAEIVLVPPHSSWAWRDPTGGDDRKINFQKSRRAGPIVIGRWPILKKFTSCSICGNVQSRLVGIFITRYLKQ